MRTVDFRRWPHPFCTTIWYFFIWAASLTLSAWLSVMKRTFRRDLQCSVFLIQNYPTLNNLSMQMWWNSLQEDIVLKIETFKDV